MAPYCLLASILFLLLLVWRVYLALNYPRHVIRADRELLTSPKEEVPELVERLISQMSTREKIQQLSGDQSMLRFCFRYGVNLFSGRGAPLVYSGRNARLGIPPFAFSDGPRGVNVGRNRTAFPVTMARGASWDRDLERRVGEAMGIEIRSIGANYSGAVCVNLLRHPGWGRAQETYGEDPYHLGEMGIALTRGLQKHNVMACVKHFALNSIENSRFYVDVRVDERSLREVYLPHFRRIVQEGEVASVMSAYNRFRGEYCGHSRKLLTDILREEWGFTGFVTSDWLHGVRDGRKGMQAGMDVEMPASHRYSKLATYLKKGLLDMAHIDRSVRCVLQTKLRYALAPDPQEYHGDLIACEEHRKLACEVAEKSMVLLKNEGVLPFQKKEISRIALIGKLAVANNTGDKGSSNVIPPYVITALEGMREQAKDHDIQVLYHDGVDEEEAAELIRKVDAVLLFVGFTHREEGEYFLLNPNRKGGKALSILGGGGDRKDIALPPEHVQSIHRLGNLNPRTAVVYVGGSAIDVSWRDCAPALLFSFYNGMEGGRALARIVFGESAPCGKLPFTIMEKQDDLPTFSPFAEEAEYGPYHGYTLCEKKGIPVAYSFGFGLGYSSFSIENLRLESTVLSCDSILEVYVDLANVGSFAGREVVQLYIGFPSSKIDRPIKLLRGFEGRRLQPGQRTQVSFRMPVKNLAYWDDESKGWRIEKTCYQAIVGRSSSDGESLVREFSVG